MRLGELSPGQLVWRLRRGRLRLRLGPFQVRVQSSFRDVARALGILYADHLLPGAGQSFDDYHVRVASPVGLRRFVRPQALFLLDGRSPFKPLPRAQAVPLLEWGLNWCVASQAHQYLILHAAVIERGGFAAILPADPGAGKSTLCAGLVHAGWRLLSDELALLSLSSGELHALARPVSLKNESLSVIRAFAPGAAFSDRFEDTSKGTISLLKPPADSVARVREPARPAWVITPEYAAGAEPGMEPASKATTFMELAHNGFNYSIHGARGFDALTALVDACACHHFRYSRLEDAVAAFDALSVPGRAA